MLSLLTVSHLAKAVEIAREQLQQNGYSCSNSQVDGLARSLIVNQDRKLVETIAKDAKSALQPFSLKELASKLMRKRLNDYKTSMQERDVQDNNSLGTTAWILQQERHNVKVFQNYMKFEEHYAGKSLQTRVSLKGKSIILVNKSRTAILFQHTNPIVSCLLMQFNRRHEHTLRLLHI